MGKPGKTCNLCGWVFYHATMVRDKYGAYYCPAHAPEYPSDNKEECNPVASCNGNNLPEWKEE